MLFCLTAQYTPSALNAIMENPTVSRTEAISKLLEAAGGKLVPCTAPFPKAQVSW
jgi:uncharacterized protein with GYD domain